MRAFDCIPPDNGHAGTMHLEAKDDDALLATAIEHTGQFHAELGLTDDQLRSIIARGAYEVEAAAEPEPAARATRATERCRITRSEQSAKKDIGLRTLGSSAGD